MYFYHGDVNMLFNNGIFQIWVLHIYIHPYLAFAASKRCMLLSPRGRENMHLLGTRDHLYLCHVLWGEVIYVWVLEDYSKWAWYKRYKVNREWDVKRFPFDNNPGNSPSYDPRFLKVLGMHNGELLIFWKARGIVSYIFSRTPLAKSRLKWKGPCAYAYI
ncbi:hypothetical protein LguiA_026696 [Lonicera macranthoides]